MMPYKNPHYHRDYFRKHGEKRRAYLRARYAADPSGQRQASAKWRRTPQGIAKRQDEARTPQAIARNRAWRKAHPEKMMEYALSQRLRRLGLDPLWYHNQLAIQAYACAICQTRDPGGRSKYRFHIDHCHTTGKIRGLLCKRCNSVLGEMKDSPNLLRRAANYLEELM